MGLNGTPMLPGPGGLPGTPVGDASMRPVEEPALDEGATLEDVVAAVLEVEPEAPDPLASVEDSTLLTIMQTAYKAARDARETRKDLNRRNWDAWHGKFAFLLKKKPGQSTIVIPSLETSLEQVISQLTSQLVGQANWFTASYEGDEPPLPGLSPVEAARILRDELDRLAVDSGCIPTTFGMTRLIHDSLQLGCIESEITWKVVVEPDEVPVYSVEEGRLVINLTEQQRLRIDLVPFDDFYPDPSSAQRYMIHEVEVAIADLPAMGFDERQIAMMRQSSPGTEKLEQQRRRSGLAPTMNQPANTVLLREYWGDLIHPHTGALIEAKCLFVTAADTHVVRRPTRIVDEYWHGLRPFIHIPLLPTPTSQVHHAFLDIAVPLIEAECELFNLQVDAGFQAGLGVKEVHSYKLKDPTVMKDGIIAGMVLERAEGRGDEPAVVRVDTGTLSPEMLTIYDRIARARGEALRTSDPQLGRFAPRKTSATELSQIDEASDDLFSNMATRLEDNGLEPLLELLWLTLWQFADESMVNRIGKSVAPENAATIALLSPEERFALFASSVGFKVQGYKYQLATTKKLQAFMQLQQMTLQNPALAQVVQTEVSPTKLYKLAVQALGLDPNELKPDPEEAMLDPVLLANQSGGQNPAQDPAMASQQEQGMPPNPQGFRGSQL